MSATSASDTGERQFEETVLQQKDQKGCLFKQCITNDVVVLQTTDRQRSLCTWPLGVSGGPGEAVKFVQFNEFADSFHPNFNPWRKVFVAYLLSLVDALFYEAFLHFTQFVVMCSLPIYIYIYLYPLTPLQHLLTPALVPESPFL